MPKHKKKSLAVQIHHHSTTQNRSKDFKEKIQEQRKVFWVKYDKQVSEARLLYIQKKYDDAAKLWTQILDYLAKFTPINIAEELHYNKVRAFVNCSHIMCSLDAKPIASTTFNLFLIEYAKISEQSQYDDFYRHMAINLASKNIFDKLKILILLHWPLIEPRSELHQAVTKAMVAKLAIEGQLNLPSPGWIISYLRYSIVNLCQAYFFLIPYLIDRNSLEEAQTQIAAAKETSLWQTHKAWLLYYEARIYYNSDYPERGKDVKKAVQLIKQGIAIQSIPALYFDLIKIHKQAPEDAVLSPGQVTGYYEVAAIQFPEAAHQLALKYIEEKDEVNAKKWYEFAATEHRYPASCYSYALLLHKNPENLKKCLSLLSIARKTIPQADFLYMKLKLAFLMQKDIFYRKQSAPKGVINKQEARKLYRDLMRLSKEAGISRGEMQLLAGMIQEFILEDDKLALDHYRAACEYGSSTAHNKVCFIYSAKILAPSTPPAEYKFLIRSLQSVLDSRKFFLGTPVPNWALDPFNLEEFKRDVGGKLEGWGDFKNFIAESKEESPLERIKTLLASDKTKLDEIVKLNFETINAEHTAELIRYAGQLANNLIVTWGPNHVEYLHTKLVLLCATLVRKLKSKSTQDHLSLWSLMCIFEGFSQFNIYSKEKDFIEPLQFLMKTINEKLDLFGYWKLIMLLESAKDFCSEIPGVPKFVENLIKHILANWSKIFTEIDGDIRLCYVLAILDNHYDILNDILTKEPSLKIILKQILTKISKTDVAEYESRLKVVKDCFFALNYFRSKEIIDLSDKPDLLRTHKEILLKNNPQTTCSQFQREVVDFITRYFTFPIYDAAIVCIESKEEKRILTKPADLGLTFAIPHPSQKGKIVLVDLFIEADGAPHFVIPLPGMKRSPIYNLDTLFYTTVLKQQGINILRMEYFKWMALTTSQRYDFFQKELAKFGLEFPPFSEARRLVKPDSSSRKSMHRTPPTEDSKLETRSFGSSSASSFGKTQQPRLWYSEEYEDDKLEGQHNKNWRRTATPSFSS